MLLHDWANGACLSKGVLDLVAGRAGGGLDVYCRYMSEASLIDENASFSGLARFGRIDKQLVARLRYFASEPTREPAHWSIFSKDDLARLGSLYNLGFLVYVYTPTASESVPSVMSSEWWIRKAQSDQTVGRLSLCHDSRGPEERLVRDSLTPILITNRPPFRLFNLPEELVSVLDARSYIWFGDVKGPAEDVCLDLTLCRGDYLEAVDRLLNLTPSPDTLARQAGPLTSLRSIITSDRSELFQRWGRSLMIASFARQSGKSFMSRSARRDPRSFLVTCLAIASELSEADNDFADHAVEDTIVVCVHARRYLMLLSEPFRLQTLIYHLDTRGLADKLLNSSDLSGVSLRLAPEVEAEAKQKRLSKKKKRASDQIVKKCRCSICRAEAYAGNMSRAGPERLCTVPYSTRDLLEMLGAYDEAGKSLLQRLVKLSVAAMDIESQTISLDFNTPRPGPRVRYEEFGGPILQGHVQKTQRPIMVGHTDTLCRERGEYWFDLVADDSPKAVYDMMARYWLRTVKLKNEAVAAKSAICEELKVLVGRYRDAFFTFANSWLEMSTIQRDYLLQAEKAKLERLLFEKALEPDQFKEMTRDAEDSFLNSDDWRMAEMKALASAFRSSIPGLLEARIAKLCGRYIVFNFYG